MNRVNTNGIRVRSARVFVLLRADWEWLTLTQFSVNGVYTPGLGGFVDFDNANHAYCAALELFGRIPCAR